MKYPDWQPARVSSGNWRYKINIKIFLGEIYKYKGKYQLLNRICIFKYLLNSHTHKKKNYYSSTGSISGAEQSLNRITIIVMSYELLNVIKNRRNRPFIFNYILKSITLSDQFFIYCYYFFRTSAPTKWTTESEVTVLQPIQSMLPRKNECSNLGLDEDRWRPRKTFLQLSHSSRRNAK